MTEHEMLAGFRAEASRLIARAGREMHPRGQSEMLRLASIAQHNAMMLAFRLAMEGRLRKAT